MKQFKLEDFLNEQQLEIIDHLVFVIRTGSHLYGTSTPESDLDYVGVYIAKKDYHLGLYRNELLQGGYQIKDEFGKNTKDSVDITLYEIKKYFQLLIQNNPNIIETLFVNSENVVYKDKYYSDLIWDMYHLFIHKGLYDRFMGYAFSQKKKMIIKSENYLDLKKAYNDLLNVEDRLTIGEVYRMNKFDWIKMTKDKLVEIGDLKFNTERLVKKVRQLIKERLDKATYRKDMYLKHGYDTKFCMHLFRLLYEGKQLLTNGKIEYPLENKNFLLDIRNGKYELDEILKMVEDLETEVRQLRETTKLPKADIDKINELLIYILEDNFYG